MTRGLRVAILSHSTNARGGVAHALELGDALTAIGHEAVVHAPDARGSGFFRGTVCATVCVPASSIAVDVTGMVKARIADYVHYFDDPRHREFDIFHAQDGISGNALATMTERGLIPGFARTVHHVDAFRDPKLMELQARSIQAATELFVVSRRWQDYLDEQFGRSSVVVGNGVDRRRYSPAPDGREKALRGRLGLATGPIFLAIGGIEARKNTIRILEAFCVIRQHHPSARLVIAGGASVLDHHDYQACFAATLAQSALPSDAVTITGPLPHADMPALYRIADTLVFPSVKEGFGLVVLEAMASGIPVVTANMAPFTEYLGAGDAAWCDPFVVHSIAQAMRVSLTEPSRGRLIERGRRCAGRHNWSQTAAAHLASYTALCEVEHA
jgi:glycosyltransferase-like protein